MDESIKNKILNHLQGYVTDTTELSDFDFNNEISDTELDLFYDLTVSYALSYLHLSELPTETHQEIIDEETVDVTTIKPEVQEGICTWCAGLIWNKYDVKVNENNEDDTTTYGYGDKLIIQAKSLLKSYKFYEFQIF
jgi:hypothetical protein